MEPQHRLYEEFVQLRLLMESVAAADTAYDQGEWLVRHKDIPLTSHCGCVAYFIRQRYGGTIVETHITDKNRKRVRHRWNILADGTHLDLTSDQFGGNGFQVIVPNGTRLNIVNISKTPNPRFHKFRMRVYELLDKQKAL